MTGIQFQTMLERAAIGALIIDGHQNIIWVNPFLATMLGYSVSELIGQELLTIIPKRYRANHRGHVDNFFQAPAHRKMGINMKIFGCRKDESEFPVDIGLSYAKDSEGNIFGMATVKDITNEKNHLEELEIKNVELREVKEKLELVNDELSEELRIEREYRSRDRRMILRFKAWIWLACIAGGIFIITLLFSQFNNETKEVLAFGKDILLIVTGGLITNLSTFMGERRNDKES